jgi:uncharacterized membrane protein
MTEARRYRLSLLDVATIVVTLALAVVALWIALRGPTGPFPVHFGIDGQPDRRGSRFEIVVLLAFFALLTAAIGGGMSLYADRTPDPARVRGLKLGQFIAVATLGLSGMMVAHKVLAANAGASLSASTTPLLMSLILVLTGAFLGRVSPNPFIGVRTPWTYKSRRSWDRTNRLGGRLLFLTGLAGLVLTPFVPAPWAFTALIVLILLTTALTVFESWRVWRDDPERQPF